MYDVYHIASETNATITDTCDIHLRDPNSLVSLQPVIHAVRDALRQDKQKPYIISNGHFFFVFLDPVYLLLSSMAVLYHVIDLLQRALKGKA